MGVTSQTALGPPVCMAYVDLTQYTYSARDSIWQSLLPYPMPHHPTSSIGPMRTPPTKDLRVVPYGKSPTAGKTRTVTFGLVETSGAAANKTSQRPGTPGQGEDGDAQDEDELDDEDDEDEPQFPIPKPEGEAGRVKRGGYRIQDRVRWGEDLYKSIRVRTQSAFDGHSISWIVCFRRRIRKPSRVACWTLGIHTPIKTMERSKKS